MANPIKGEVDFPVGDKTYRLRLSINQIIEVEDLLGVGIIKIAGMFNDVESLTAGSPGREQTVIDNSPTAG